MENLQDAIHYEFRQKKLLRQALTHSSYANEHHIERLYNNERLEFLGDAVLELISSDLLFRHFPQMHEGELSKKRASLVCEPALAYCARQLQLGKYLRLGHGEDINGGRDRDSILSDALEAVIGALYLDGGYEVARTFVLQYVLNDLENKELFHDSKTALQEMVQSKVKDTVTYQLLEAQGPEHNRSFVVQAMVGDIKLCTGRGRTKQSAGQDAAYKSIIMLKENPGLIKES
ncbi:ribonuclease-3 [Catenibacillus scindens]|uniref:Ribonuclease 3 n=1 Tax=Catenibacillus scindens TaxID=673271 RepID=A0A7W8HDC0_9FIRM|nr:ribonuclease III [Catenibacillus scindens]MBB5266220.1 ribonuclease-3 [Catenibacillus scindens]